MHSRISEPIELTIELRGGKAESASQTVLTHDQLNAHNTFDEPKEVTPRTSATALKGAAFTCTLAPASVTRVDLQLA